MRTGVWALVGLACAATHFDVTPAAAQTVSPPPAAGESVAGVPDVALNVLPGGAFSAAAVAAAAAGAADTTEVGRSSRGGGTPLRRILALAEQNHPTLAESRAKLLQVQAQLDEAHFAPFSQFKFTGGIGLAPTIRGNNTFSPNTDVALTSSLGLAWRAGIEGAVPLWTFGKIENLWDAAEANVKLTEADIEKQRDIIRYDVRRAFFGLQLARDARILLADVRAQLSKAEKRLEKAIEEDDGDPIELLKLKTFASDLDVREAEAERYERIALAGLRFYTGVDSLEIPDAPIRPPAHQLGHLTRYFTAARLYRPELRQAAAGLDARRAQVELARSMFYPDFGLGLQASLSTAPEVANQLNPFVRDPGNFFGYGFAFVVRWDLDFLPQAARVRYAEAQLEEMRATQRYALGGVGVEVESAYAEVVDWQKRLDAHERAMQYAKQWLLQVQQGIDLGVEEESELLDPAKAYALQRFNVLNATMELDLAMSRLARATGWDAIAPRGE